VALDTTVDIDTPESIRFRYRLAGPIQRGLAYLIDLAIRLGIALALGLLLLVGGVRSEQWRAASIGIGLLAVFVLEWGYYVVCETFMGGRSPGKRALKLRVVKEGGEPITFLDSFLRNLLRAADFLPGLYLVGGLVMSIDARFRRLGDLVASTIVIVEKRDALRSPVVIYPPPRPAELAELPARVRLSPDELEAIELFLRRKNWLTPERERELADMLAPSLAARFGLTMQDPSRLLALLYLRGTERASGEGAGGPRERRRP
jgi:uncharacterized RDD family membrane protein YckC